MGERKKAEYIDKIWNDADDNMLRLFFGKKLYFLRQLDIELMKIRYPDIYEETENVVYETRKLEELSLHDIGKVNPEMELRLREMAFEKAKTSDDKYQCAACGMKNRFKACFHVDHIIPMNQGGKSVPENLQILCRRCNGIKGDQI